MKVKATISGYKVVDGKIANDLFLKAAAGKFGGVIWLYANNLNDCVNLDVRLNSISCYFEVSNIDIYSALDFAKVFNEGSRKSEKEVNEFYENLLESHKQYAATQITIDDQPK